MKDQVDQRYVATGKGTALLHRRAGFTKKTDFSNGPYRWLTVAHPTSRTERAAARPQRQPAGQGLPASPVPEGPACRHVFTDDVKGDYERIKARGAEFKMPPDRGNRLDHCPAERHLRQPRSNHTAGALVGQGSTGTAAPRTPASTVSTACTSAPRRSYSPDLHGVGHLRRVAI